MKKLKYFAFALPLLLFSCVTDDSKYGGNELDEIVIEGIPTGIQIEVGTNMKIEPTVKTKFGDQSQLSYVWYKYNEAQFSADTLSFEKNLDVPIVDVLPGVVTTLAFKVTDQTTGIFELHKTSFTTVGRYSGGTLMLCRSAGEYDLAMLKSDGVTFYDNIFSLTNSGQKLPANTTRLFLADGDTRNKEEFKAVIVASNDHTGGYYLDPVIFTPKSTMRNKFLFPEDMPETMDITHYSNNQGNDILVVNGHVYYRPNYSTTYDPTKNQWYPEAVVLGEPSDYHIAPYVVHYSASSGPYYGSPIFFDNNHGRMLYSNDGGAFMTIGGADSDFSKFDPNNLGKGVEMVICGNTDGSANRVWALLKNTNSGDFVLITYHMNDPGNWKPLDFISDTKVTLSRATHPALYSATGLVSGTKQKVDTFTPWRTYTNGVSDVFFFINDNKVYAFNAKAATYGVLIDGNAENYTITGVDCTQVPAPTEENQNATMSQLTLRVKDNSLTTTPGGIAVYKLSSVGGLTAEKLFAKTGFCDEVVHSVEKID